MVLYLCWGYGKLLRLLIVKARDVFNFDIAPASVFWKHSFLGCFVFLSSFFSPLCFNCWEVWLSVTAAMFFIVISSHKIFSSTRLEITFCLPNGEMQQNYEHFFSKLFLVYRSVFEQGLAYHIPVVVFRRHIFHLPPCGRWWNLQD